MAKVLRRIEKAIAPPPQQRKPAPRKPGVRKAGVKKPGLTKKTA